MNDSPSASGQTHAIIVAAGSGERAGLDLPKQYANVRGKPMVRHSAEVFLAHPSIDRLWIVVGEGQDDLLTQSLSGLSGYHIVTGGASRQQSVSNGLSAIAASKDRDRATTVLIHDAARPFLKPSVIDRLLMKTRDNKGAIPVLPTIDTVIKVTDNQMQHAIDRRTIWRVQTPQIFAFPELLKAHKAWVADIDATDDAQIMNAAGHKIATVAGDEALAKFTTPNDFELTAGKNMTQVRTGMGFDVHRLVEGEELWLGGLKIPHDKGLSGHSDADVLLHALTDALLGAIGAGDIGDHFPPSDPKWHGAASHQFVKHAISLIKEKGGCIHNVDMTLICEAPKIKPHREAIRSSIAKLLDISIDQVSVKATTTEGLGFTGRGEGIAAQAIATISQEEL